MKLLKFKKPNIKEWVAKVRGLKREDIKAYRRKRKERRERILAKRRESKWARAMAPIMAFFERFSILFEALWACILYLVMEAISRHSVGEAITYMVESPWTFLYNAFMIFVTFSVVYLLKRRAFARIIISLLWLLLGIMNGYMLMKRVTPFNAQDLKMASDAISMINSYFTPVEFAMLVMAIIAVIIWIISMWRRGQQYTKKMHRGIALIVCVVWGVLFSFATDVALENRIVSNYFGNIAFAYQDYGLPYCFMASIFDTGISKPIDYTEESLMDITNQGSMSTTVATEREELPNIIVVQLESFFDPAEVEFLEMSTDPIPNFRSMAQKYSSGYFKVPSVGAGTANTEFEVLTGMNMRSFGPGEYPYKTILQEQMVESAATALESLGYGAYALHNNGGNFYSRAKIYNHMGFDSYVSKEFMNIIQYTPQGWATDDILVENILECMDQTEQQDFVFAVSVEGHGSYPEEAIIDNPTVTLSGLEDEGIKNSWEYYLELVHEMDQFAGDLVAEVEKRGEPAVVVFYGDHLPTLGLTTNDLVSRYLYNTNYVIWDNIGLEKQDQNIAAYQLTAKVLEQIGIDSGTIFNYHQERVGTTNYLSDLEILQYDLLYGEQYAYQDADILAEEGHMQMGVKDVELTYIVERGDNKYGLYGENFTPWSQVYVNGEKQKKSFVSDCRIDLRNSNIENDDIIWVSQVGSSDTIFRTSGEYTYSNGRLLLHAPVQLGTSWYKKFEEITENQADK